MATEKSVRELLDIAQKLDWGAATRNLALQSVLDLDSVILTFPELLRVVQLADWGESVRKQALDRILDQLEKTPNRNMSRQYARMLIGRSSPRSPGFTNHGGNRWKRAEAILRVENSIATA